MNKLKDIYNDYKKDFIRIFKIKKEKIESNYLDDKNKQKKIIFSSLFIIVFVLVLNLFMSYAYYNESTSLPIIHAKVGNMYTNQYDYVLLIYLEDTDNYGNGSGSYHLTDEIPLTNYVYSGYNCQNNSVLVYDDEAKVTSVTLNEKDICSIYFNLINSMDLVLKVMVEDSVNSDNYILTSKIPYYGYKYSHYICENNSELDYNKELHSVKLASKNKDSCSIYFTKEEADISINLYIEDKLDSNNYIESTIIPSTKLYSLNTEKSSCKNTNDERIDSTITYINGEISIEADGVSYCSVYLDIENE